MGAIVVVGVNAAVVVVVEDVVEASTIASTVAVAGGFGVTPVGSKAIVTRRFFVNLIEAGSVVSVGFV